VGYPEESVAAEQNGAMLACIVMELGVVTAAVVETMMLAISTSSTGTVVSGALVISISAVAPEDVTLVVPEPSTVPLANTPLVPVEEVLPLILRFNVTPIGITVNVNRISVLCRLGLSMPNNATF